MRKTMETQQSLTAALTLLALAAIVGDYVTTEKLRRTSGFRELNPLAKWLIGHLGRWWAVPKLGTAAGAVVVGLYVPWPLSMGILIAIIVLLVYSAIHNMQELRK
jgi:hypothetical protein